MARRRYKCQFLVTVDWANATMAHEICKEGRRKGALTFVNLIQACEETRPTSASLSEVSSMGFDPVHLALSVRL